MQGFPKLSDPLTDRLRGAGWNSLGPRGNEVLPSARYGPPMHRRNFIGTTLASASAVAARAATGHRGDVPTRTFGKTGEHLTVVGQAGGRFPLCSFDEAKAIVQRAYDLGINYFDNAHSYWGGRSEEVFGEVLPAVRKDVFITTKTTNRTRGGAAAELRKSLQRMKTDYVDLWQIHSVNRKEEVERIFGPGGAIEAFEAAKRDGLCRYIGFTGHRDPYVHLAMLEAYDDYDTILMPLHPADPGYLSFEDKVLPVAQKRNLGIQGMKVLANAKLLQSLSVRQCIQYVLSLPVHCIAVGCTTIGQIEDDVRIAREFRPYDADELLSIRQRASKLAGAGLEDWKRDTQQAFNRPEYTGG